jgi:hypothetical protein
MRRALFAMLVLSGCARAGSGAGGDDDVDAPGPRVDASPETMIDAPPTPPPDGPCVPMTTQLLINPVFDLTPIGMGWTQQLASSGSGPLVSNNGSLTSHSAPYKALLGIVLGNNATDMLYQDVMVPPMTTTLRVTGQYAVRSNDYNDNDYDRASAALTQMDGTPITTLLLLTNRSESTASSWTSFSHTFTQNLSGQTVRLRFTSTSDSGGQTSFYFDSLALTATHGCP